MYVCVCIFLACFNIASEIQFPWLLQTRLSPAMLSNSFFYLTKQFPVIVSRELNHKTKILGNCFCCLILKTGYKTGGKIPDSSLGVLLSFDLYVLCSTVTLFIDLKSSFSFFISWSCLMYVYVFFSSFWRDFHLYKSFKFIVGDDWFI